MFTSHHKYIPKSSSSEFTLLKVECACSMFTTPFPFKRVCVLETQQGNKSNQAFLWMKAPWQNPLLWDCWALLKTSKCQLFLQSVVLLKSHSLHSAWFSLCIQNGSWLLADLQCFMLCGTKWTMCEACCACSVP